ncbi:sugar phosphate isomerase/epimerase [Bacillus oleivorans]|uniref:Sugar phosphate isomerase/epimerase n=1 Tax=Bacillus oleivorans TaxID=1448271 RepID=A0A285CYM7_9BACI|nr:sugar phosphate isomerase/epimerase family protein [Bacillus oleivorans]SNX72674.1 sugar phosphate isomerase/epimerase [Bacillus oleivorans]
MKISISMYSLNSAIQKEGWSTVDFIQYAKSIDLDGVELLDFYWKSRGSKDEEIKEVLEVLANYNLQVSAYDVTNNFVKESKEERVAEIAKVIDGIYTAKQLGTHIVRVFCGDLHGDLTYEDGQGWIVDGLRECAKVAEAEEIYLAIENHGLLAGKSKQVKEIIEMVDSPYVKSTFDTGNFLLVHEGPTEAFNYLKDEIIHVHFKDFRKKEPNNPVKGFRSTQGVEVIGVVPGDGEVDLAYIVNGLKADQYNGWLSIEYEGFDDAKEANKEAVQRLKNLLGRG